MSAVQAVSVLRARGAGNRRPGLNECAAELLKGTRAQPDVVVAHGNRTGTAGLRLGNAPGPPTLNVRRLEILEHYHAFGKLDAGPRGDDDDPFPWQAAGLDKCAEELRVGRGGRHRHEEHHAILPSGRGCDWDNAPVRSYERAVATVAARFGLQISRLSSADQRLPIEASPHDAALIARLRPYSMTSAERLWSLLNAVRHVVNEAIPGDFVECGVWRGGSVMAMAYQLQVLGVTDRRIWLYDTFAGMSVPTAPDIESGTGRSAQSMLDSTMVGDGNNVWCVAGRAEVEENLRATSYPTEQFTIVEGDVSRTLHEQAPNEIALLRLDTDWYESTKVELEVLYPRLAVGGVCILDDYGHWEGARQAVDEYFNCHGPRPYMHPIDYSGRVFIKTRHA